LLNYFDIPRKRYSYEIKTKVSKENREKTGLKGINCLLGIFHSDYTRKMLFMRKGKTFSYKYYQTKKEKPCTYYGNVYLLQSNVTFSAAISLSSFFKYYKFGPIIGEETGGLTACYIDSYSCRLPNSNFYMYCSAQEYIYPNGKWDGRGVLPDIEYKIENLEKSFTLEQLKEMLQLVEEYNKNK